MKCIKVKSAGGIVYYIEGNQIYYLLLKHIKTGSHWGFPKGRLDESETERDAAKREIKEETGITEFSLEKDFCEKINYSFEKDNIVRNKTVTYFLANVKHKITKLSKEHSEFFWGEYDQVLKKLTNKTDKNAFKKANDFLKINLSAP